MKKSVIFLLIAGMFLASCQPSNDPVKIKEQIFKYKEQIAELNLKINELEDILSESDSINIQEGVFVAVENVKVEAFEHFFEATGSVEAVNDAFISPQYSGQIQNIYVEEGDRVVKGQLLADLNSEVLQNSIVELENGLSLATTLFEKQEELWNQNIGSELEYLQAKNSKEGLEKSLNTLYSQLKLTKVYAPFSGIVDEIYQKEGELGVPGARLLQLVNLSEMYINADVSESYLSSIFEKDSVYATFPSYPELEFNTTIYQKGNIIESANRTFNVKVKIKNIDEKIKPNLLAVLKLKDFSTDSALLVPSIVVNQDINGQFLYVAQEVGGKTLAKKVYVTTGQSNNESTIIEDGLKVGDKVITEGFNLVKDGSEIYFN